MTTPERMLQRVHYMRGKLLQVAIEVETLLDIYISKHFTQDDTKQSEIIALLLAPRASFEGKFQIFNYIVDKYNPEFKAALPKYSRDLSKIIEMRNIVAHFPVEFSEEYQRAFEVDESISFIKLKNSKDFGLSAKGTLTPSDFEQNINVMETYVANLHKLVGHL